MTTARSTPPSPVQRRPVQHRMSSTVLGLVVPLGILAAGAGVAWAWRDELPAQVAIHWGSDGPDGFSSLAALLVGSVVGGAASTVALWAYAFWAGRVRTVRQLAVGLGVGITTLVAGITVGTLAPQRGLADGADVGGVGGPLTLAVVAALVLGLLAALAVPRDAPSPELDRPRDDAPRIPLTADERAVWVRRTASSTGVVIVLLAAVFVTATVIVAGSWPLLVVPVALVLLSLAMFSWTVTVDDTGLTVRSTLGVPRRHLPIDEIVDAGVDHVVPLRDFGGYGWRTSTDGRTGVVIRGGETLEVRSTGGRRFVVTVDDAATAAALLNALADRHRASRPAPEAETRGAGG